MFQRARLGYIPVPMKRTLIILGGLLCGCITARPGPVATAVPEERATPGYWYEQPAAAGVVHDDFDLLWQAAERTARNRLFQIDRTDYRNGILTTRPLVSQQLFEPWRSDTPLQGQAQSTLGTVRRTIRFEIERAEDGTYTLLPKVLVERQSIPQQRITNAAHYRAAVMAAPGQVSDEGARLPGQYWYAIGRDADLERALAAEIQRRLRRKQQSAASDG